MNKIWFISDTHFGHTNIAGKTVSKWSSGYRNFSSVEEMNETIVNNINECVEENDTLYHLGDWSFGNPSNIKLFRQMLLCKDIHLIYGNHDKHIKKDDRFKSLFSSVQDYKKIYIDKQCIILCHYGMRVWDGSHRGTWMLYGHSHGTLPSFGKSMDVGIDTRPEFKPYSFNEIERIMSKANTEFPDHHIKTTDP